MNTQTVIHFSDSQLIDDDVSLTLVELCQACNGSHELVTSLVLEGVLEPAGGHPQEWRFSGTALYRARLAQRLSRDLEINTPGIALVIDLMEQIQMLQAQLARESRY